MSLFSKQIDKRIAAYQRELIETHYREVDNMYRQIRGWRHDYRNHIQTMKVLAANGDMDAIKEYLDELDTDLNTVDTVVKTGNAMVDAILNSKISLAQSKFITVHCDAQIPVKLKMSELDLCCIIGNLFDNAIEASLSLPEDQRQIRVYMDMKGTQLYISFTNFTSTKKLEKLGRKKSAVIVAALLEYMDNHPELTDGDQSHVTVNTMSLDALEVHISRLIEEKLRGIELPSRGESIPHEQAEEVSQDIMDMLDDLNLFNM